MRRLLAAAAFLGLLLPSPASAADWYVSSVAYTAVAAWAASHSYAANAIVRQLTAPAVNSERVFNTTGSCTSGTTEPTWVLTSGASTTDNAGGGTCTWHEITGVSSHQQDNGTTTTWAAPAARVGDLNSNGKNTIAAGDRIFLSSDHAETQSTALTLPLPGTTASPNLVISASRTSGNVPPVAGDITSGASIATTATSGAAMQILSGSSGSAFFDGISFSAVNGTIQFGSGTANTVNAYLLNGSLTAAPSASTNGITPNAGIAFVILDNTTVTLGSTSACIGGASNSGGVLYLVWKNTASAIGGATIPSKLFCVSTSVAYTVIVRGVDLTAMGANALVNMATNTTQNYFLFENDKIGASTNIVTGTPDPHPLGSIVEAVNVDSGATNYRSERHTYQGDLTTDTSTTRSGGASNGTAYAHKIVTASSTTGKWLMPFSSFPILAWNATTGSSITEKVEIISSGTLNNDDVYLECQYLGSASSPLASGITTQPATPLTANAAIATSSVTWNNPPATPAKQVLSATFTPQMAGLVSCAVKVWKASATLWVDPVLHQ